MAKANWHLDVTVDQSDPFAAPADAAPADVRQAGQRIELASDDLLIRLAAMMRLEGQLHNRGISCTLKDRSDSCCSACPLRGTLRVDPIKSLCTLGVQQERTLMNLVADA